MTSSWLVAIALGCSACTTTVSVPVSDPSPFELPDQVAVRPIFFIPSDQAPPTADQQDRFARHLAWAQRRYGEMLGQRDTFGLASATPELVLGAHEVQFYLDHSDHGVSEVTAELLAHDHATRFTNPYIYVTVLMNSVSEDPAGYGRPCNGGLGGGGGVLVVSSTTFDSPNFQSTLQHELGHSFGLPHVDAYGYDMTTNASIMSYNVAQWTNGFAPSATPGTLIPEDLHALAMNHRVFSSLVFDPATDVPRDYMLARVVPLPAMDIPGQPPNLVTAATASGELYDSAVGNIVQGMLEPSRGPGITFDPSVMWHSDVTTTGEVAVELAFPVDVTLTQIRVHSQHSGLYHAAIAARVEARTPDSDYVEVAGATQVSVDGSVAFPATAAREWRLDLQPGESGMVVLRGLQFFVDGAEIFPPFASEP